MAHSGVLYISQWQWGPKRYGAQGNFLSLYLPLDRPSWDLRLIGTCALFYVLFRPVNSYRLLMTIQEYWMFAAFFDYPSTENSENYANI